jgi:hypothetical protein
MSNEDDIIYEEAGEEGKIKNLNATLQLLLQQYHDFVNRKERLENKALGYLTPLSVLLAAMVAILIMLSQKQEKRIEFILFLICFAGQVYFSVYTFFYALKAYSVKTSFYPDIKEHSLKWKIKEDCFLGRINNGFNKTIEELNEILSKLVFDVQMCRIYLTFSMIFGILGILIFIVYILQAI